MKGLSASRRGWCPTARVHRRRGPSQDIAQLMPIPAEARYRPGMPRVEVPEVKIRPTGDSEGHVHGLVIGEGPDPHAATKELKEEARILAEGAAERYSARQGAYDSRPFTEEEMVHGRREAFTPRNEEPKVWRFEVIDLRLAPGPVERQTGWVAYGTLVATTESPV
jgi:hypothetical protein